jgi:hypothetical protein
MVFNSNRAFPAQNSDTKSTIVPDYGLFGWTSPCRRDDARQAHCERLP